MVGFADVCPTRSTRPNIHKNNNFRRNRRVVRLSISSPDTDPRAPESASQPSASTPGTPRSDTTRRGRRPRNHSTPGTPRDFGSNASGAVRQRLRSRGGQTHGPSPITRAAMGADSERRSAAICPLRPRLAPILQHARQPKADGHLDCAALRAYVSSVVHLDPAAPEGA